MQQSPCLSPDLLFTCRRATSHNSYVHCRRPNIQLNAKRQKAAVSTSAEAESPTSDRAVSYPSQRAFHPECLGFRVVSALCLQARAAIEPPRLPCSTWVAIEPQATQREEWVGSV